MSHPGGNPFAKGASLAYLLDSIFNCNSWQAREPALQLYTKIVNNIVANPSEAKFRKLNTEKVMAKFGAQFRGMAELLRRVGFVADGANLLLPESAPLAPLSQSLEAWSEREAKLAAGRAEAERVMKENMAAVSAEKAKKDAARELILKEQRQARLAVAAKPVNASRGNELTFGATLKQAPPPPPPSKGG